MNFSNDRDLLMLEPTLFHDVPWVAQARVRVEDAMVTTVAGGTNIFSAQADFAAAEVGAGSVVLLDAVACEVVERIDEETLIVSLPRSRPTDAAIPVPGYADDMPALDQALVARTFSPQAATVHDALLRLLGIEADDPESRGDEVVESVAAMARLEALGTLERVFSAAASLTGNNTGLLMKAAHYRDRFRHVLSTASIWVDPTGDGRGRERRCFGLTRLRRV